MKNIKNTFAILLISLLAIACSKDDDVPSTIPIVQDDSFFKAKIDGVEYSAPANQVSANLHDSGTLDIQSVDSSGKSFRIIIEDVTLSVATLYPFPISSGLSSYNIFYGDGSNFFTATPNGCGTTFTGELKITSITETEVSGTFTYTGVTCLPLQTVQITDGSFKAKINQN